MPEDDQYDRNIVVDEGYTFVDFYNFICILASRISMPYISENIARI
jgi:hypothetical protein